MTRGRLCRWTFRAAFWAGILGFHLAIPWVFLPRHNPIPDEGAYTNLAANLATKGSYHLDYPSYWHTAGQPNTHFAPGWPALLSLGYLALGGEAGFWWVIGAVWCANAVLIFTLARTLDLPLFCCRLLVLWLTLNPLFIFYHAHLMSEALTITACLGITILGLLFIKRPSWRAVVLLGIVAALGHLVRTQTLLAALAVWLVAGALFSWRDLFGYGCIFTITYTAILAPWLWRMNEVGAGMTATELKLGVNLYSFSGTATADPYGQPAESDWQWPPGIESASPRERNNALVRSALREIAAHPERYLARCLKRLTFLLSPVPNFYDVSPLQYWAVMVSSLLFFHAFLAAVAARALWPVRLNVDQWTLLLSLGLWYLLHVLINASIRNRLPSDVWCAALAVSLWVQPGPALWGSSSGSSASDELQVER
jgi:hypothetical protein